MQATATEGRVLARARPADPFTRLFLLQLGLTLFVVGFPLFVLSGRTDDYFAWTIQPSLTAAFLGANYWGSAVLALSCAREREWAAARVTVPGIFVAGTFLLIATLLHLEPFHMDTARGWIWLILYAGLPPAVALVVMIQRRVAGEDPPVVAPLSRTAERVLAAQGMVFLGLGAALFLLPAETTSIWPWSLSDLAGRAVGAWLLAIGTTLLVSRREGDWARLTGPMAGYLAIALLQVFALLRYLDTPDWGDVATWLYAGFLASVLAVGVVGTATSLRVKSRRTSPAPVA